jgi:hypothetical protein
MFSRLLSEMVLFTPACKHQCSTKEVIIEYIKGLQALNIKSKIIAFQIPQL